MEQIHGHEVIALIKDANPAIKQDELINTIKENFGDAKFHTCSVEGMSAEELIEFLESRDKLFFENGEVHIKEANICDHD
jgi:probable metal-binding protein